MKLSLRFLLLLSLFVLGKQTISYAGIEDECDIAIITPAHHNQNHGYRLKAIELNEQNQSETPCIKKTSTAGNHFFFNSYAPAPASIHAKNTRLAYSKPYFYSPPDKHILFQVFRI